MTWDRRAIVLTISRFSPACFIFCFAFCVSCPAQTLKVSPLPVQLSNSCSITNGVATISPDQNNITVTSSGGTVTFTASSDSPWLKFQSPVPTHATSAGTTLSLVPTPNSVLHQGNQFAIVTLRPTNPPGTPTRFPVK